MKPTKTKSQVSREINSQVSEFLSQGGTVNGVPSGVSGRVDNSALPVNFEPQKKSRTPVLEAIQALEARKKGEEGQVSAQARVSRPKKLQRKLITDDFGEPIRWVWVEN